MKNIIITKKERKTKTELEQNFQGRVNKVERLILESSIK